MAIVSHGSGELAGEARGFPTRGQLEFRCHVEENAALVVSLGDEHGVVRHHG